MSSILEICRVMCVWLQTKKTMTPPWLVPLHPAIITFWSTWLFFTLILHLLLIPFLCWNNGHHWPEVPVCWYQMWWSGHSTNWYVSYYTMVHCPLWCTHPVTCHAILFTYHTHYTTPIPCISYPRSPRVSSTIYTSLTVDECLRTYLWGIHESPYYLLLDHTLTCSLASLF